MPLRDSAAWKQHNTACGTTCIASGCTIPYIWCMEVIRTIALAARAAVERPINRKHAMVGALLGGGVGLVLLTGGGAILAGAACGIIALMTALFAGEQTYGTSLRLWSRQKTESARANVAMMVASLLAARSYAVSVAITLLGILQRLQGLTRQSANRRTARCGHRRIVHIALTARVIPAPIARA
ncbi:hypothetical protein [Thiomonas sp.]|uniref:hypothetical protein n=2 Tax=Burkholderiales genera incertae sedis TaxID=224471 RepID=UPI002588C02C|nr:hypothetical protein [Thiomonas sp.]